MIPNKEHTKQFTDSYCSTKCNGCGNGRKQSLITAKLRRQVNKKRRLLLKVDLQKQLLIIIALFLLGCNKPKFNDWLSLHIKTCPICIQHTDKDMYELCPVAWKVSHPNCSN